MSSNCITSLLKWSKTSHLKAEQKNVRKAVKAFYIHVQSRYLQLASSNVNLRWRVNDYVVLEVCPHPTWIEVSEKDFRDRWSQRKCSNVREKGYYITFGKMPHASDKKAKQLLAPKEMTDFFHFPNAVSESFYNSKCLTRFITQLQILSHIFCPISIII